MRCATVPRTLVGNCVGGHCNDSSWGEVLSITAWVVQLRAAVAELMAAVRAMPPLSMEAVNVTARLALPQIGCSNLKCVSLPAEL